MATTIFLVNPREGAVTPPSYLLDTYSATVAYSLRQLKTGVTSVVRVRRSSDNRESDFTATEITDGTLTGFCGGGDGFVVTWYDQSGNANDATQSTASLQPKLVSSGVVETSTNGLPAIDYNGSSNYLSLSYATTTNTTEAFVYERLTSGINSIGFGSTGANPFLSFWLGSNNTTYWRPAGAAGAIVENASTSTGEFLSFTVQSSGTASHWKNAVAKLTPSYSWTASGNTLTTIGRRSSNYHEGYMQECIIWNTDESSNRTAIESDINGHYSIY